MAYTSYTRYVWTYPSIKTDYSNEYSIVRGTAVNINLGYIPRYDENIQYITASPPSVQWDIATQGFPAGLTVGYKIYSSGSLFQVYLSGTTTVPPGEFQAKAVFTPKDTKNTKTFTFNAKITIADPVGTPPVPVNEDPTTEVGTLSWWAVMPQGRNGAKLRRSGWQDRWIQFDEALWWLHIINPITKTQIAKRLVTMPDWTKDEFMVSDWTTSPLI